MRRRMGRPGLVGTMARTAVIAGTATAVSGGVQRRGAARAQAAANEQAEDAQVAEMQAQLAELQAQQQSAPPPPPPPPPAAAPAAPGGDDLMAQLQKLADMKNAGLLDDAEFAAAKAKLLA
jgi:soluble cytochrome b562